MRVKSLTLLIVLAGTALQAHAMDDRLYLAPTLNYTFSDSDRRADDDWGLGIALGKPITPNLNMELALTGSSLDFKTGSGEYELVGLGVDALYLFNRMARFTPYGVAGLGVLRTDIPGADDTGLMANIGLGLMTRLSDRLSLRGDVRYRWDGNAAKAFGENHFEDVVVSLGLSIALGPKARPAPEPVAQRTPEPAPSPEPAAPAVTTPQTQLDEAKPGDVIVTLEGVNFEFDSARLRPDAITILDEAVTVLDRRKDINVDIVGHTCSIGTTEYNQGLSERRARSVYDYLVNQGTAADRLTTRGFGETQPAFSNATREGREKNRRVELKIK